MHITEIQIKNFRLLKNFSINLTNPLSIIIGKNNTGKTSFIMALQTFLSSDRKITFYDINTDMIDEIKTLLQRDSLLQKDEYKEDEYQISLSMCIQYEEEDNLANISQFIVDLDPDNKCVLFHFSYKLSYNSYKELYESYKNNSKSSESPKNDMDRYLKRNLIDSLSKVMYSYYEKDDLRSYHSIKDEKVLKNVLKLKVIKAPREFLKSKNTTLSDFAKDLYKLKQESDRETINEFKNSLEDIEQDLNKAYDKLFSETFSSMKKYIDDNAFALQVISTLSDDEDLFQNNTELQYGNNLPEHYNGLGYLNFLSILFEIYLLIEEQKSKKTTDIVLLSIEEPEAHTHPQMQYIFINNIKKLLQREESINIQSILSSHSSHIISQASFDDMRYFYLDDTQKTQVKVLSEIEKEFEKNKDLETFQFIKKYLTLNSSELFFSDKLIII